MLRFWEAVTVLAMTACGGRAVALVGAAGQAGAANGGRGSTRAAGGVSSGGKGGMDRGGARGIAGTVMGTGGAIGIAGSSSGGAGGCPGVMFGFEGDDRGFIYDVNQSSDPLYTNVGDHSSMTWDGGEGVLGEPGKKPSSPSPLRC